MTVPCDAMACIVGPRASRDLLLRYMREQRDQVHWAVNSYFRDALSNPQRDDVDLVGCTWPTIERPVAIRTLSMVSSEADEDTEWLVNLPDDLLQSHVCWLLSPPELARLAGTCKRARDLVGADDTLWRRPYATLQQPWATEGPPPPGAASWKEALRDLIRMVRAAKCVRCREGRVVPLLFGFPSPPLMRGAERGTLKFGWDFKTANDPSWVCRACGARFHEWPWGRSQRPAPDPTPHVRPVLTVLSSHGHATWVRATPHGIAVKLHLLIIC